MSNVLKKPIGWPTYAITLLAVGLFVFGVLAAITQDLLKALIAALAVDASLLSMSLGCVSLLLLAVLVHEGGHAIVARLVGIKVYGFRVGAYEKAFLTSGTRWRRVKPRSALSGGVHLADDRLEGMLRRRVLVLLAGPVATAIIGLILLTIWRGLSGDRAWDDSAWIFGPHPFLDFLIYLPLYAGAVMLMLSTDVFLPIKRHGVASDGLQLFWSVAKPQELRNSIALASVYVPWQYGVRGRNWNIKALDYIRDHATQDAWKITSDFFSHYYYLDRGDLEMALKRIVSAAELALQQNPTLNHDSVLSAAAYALAYMQHNAEGAKRYLALCKNQEATPYTTMTRARVAVLVAEGRMDEASAVLKEAIVELDKLGKDVKEENDAAELDFLRRPVDHPLPDPIVIT